MAGADGCARAREVEAVLAAATAWAAHDPSIRAIGLVGSRGRGTARADSDVDLLVLATDPDALLGERAWFAELGDVELVRIEDSD